MSRNSHRNSFEETRRFERGAPRSNATCYSLSLAGCYTIFGQKPGRVVSPGDLQTLHIEDRQRRSRFQ
jgi:hypothetical protein